MTRQTPPLRDISLPITPEMVSWRDAYPPETTWHSHTGAADPTSNSTWRLHAHTGTHRDAPSHHLPGGRSIDALALDDGLGPCRVVDLTTVPGQVGADAVEAINPLAGERLLLRTRNSPHDLLRSGGFTSAYVGLTADGAARLVEAGVRLVGIDSLSVECPDAAGAPAHHLLLGAGVAVLEGLVLTDIAPGTYQLLFLPLALSGAEAAPGRAVLLDTASPE